MFDSNHPCNSISARNQRAARDSEALLWRALCDDGGLARSYLDPDCVVVNPLIHPAGASAPLSATSSPTLAEALRRLRPWTTCRMHRGAPPQEPAIVEVDMMSVCIMHRVTVTRAPGGPAGAAGAPGAETREVGVTSVWRQNAGGDYHLCAQQAVLIDGGGEGGR